jgi:AraC family transcriptional regulator, positive regulator of tynA and feaB
MAQIQAPVHDRPSHPVCGQLVELSTEAVPGPERLDYWASTVLKRTVPVSPQEERPFRARLRRIVLDGVELVEHASDAVIAMRAPGRLRFDGGDDIAIELMRDCDSALLDHNGEHRLKPGDLYVVDYALPLQVARSRHRAGGVVLSRRRVTEVLGQDLSALAGRRIQATGLAAVLRQHMMATIDEAPRMSEAQRVLAVQGAAEMGLAILQAGRLDVLDAQQFGEGFYQAARKLIERQCGDPNLTPGRVALALGCSRASLYRVFARHDKSVSAAIWSARLEQAWRLLTSSSSVGMRVSDTAFQCGYRDQATFARMFRRRYGMTPRDSRETGRLLSASR